VGEAGKVRSVHRALLLFKVLAMDVQRSGPTMGGVARTVACPEERVGAGAFSPARLLDSWTGAFPPARLLYSWTGDAPAG